jgi:Uma2 family endonuclease
MTALAASSLGRTSHEKAWRWTRADYYRLSDLGFFAGKRVELLRGEIVEMSPVGWPHVVSCRKTAELLATVFANIGWVSRGEPINLTDSDPQPDVMVVPGKFEDFADHPTTALLIVEVADTTLTRDTTTKAEIYATAGIADYWVIDLDARQVWVFRDPTPMHPALGTGATYRSVAKVPATDPVSPLARPGVTIVVAGLLPDAVG